MSDELAIKTKLDRLADFQAQRDLIEIQKRELLEAVKTPAEVQDIVSLGNQRIAEIQRLLRPEIEALEAEYQAKLAEIAVPDAIRAAYEAIERRRGAVLADQKAAQEAVYQKALERERALRAEIENQVRGTFNAISARKAEIEDEFGGQAQAVDANIAALEDEIKRDTEAHGESVKGKFLHAIYSPGRVTWNTEKLDGMVALIPQIGEARKVGKPSISIRAVRP